MAILSIIFCPTRLAQQPQHLGGGQTLTMEVQPATTVLYSVGKAGQPHSYNMWHLFKTSSFDSFEPLGTGFVRAALKLVLRCQAGALLAVLSSLR